MKVHFVQALLLDYSLPNFLTASTIDFVCSITAYIECSLKSICWAIFSASTALALGMTTTPSLSAATMSPAFTVTPSQVQFKCKVQPRKKVYEIADVPIRFALPDRQVNALHHVAGPIVGVQVLQLKHRAGLAGRPA